MGWVDFIYLASHHKGYNPFFIHIHILCRPHDMAVPHDCYDVGYLLYLLQSVGNIDTGNPPVSQLLNFSKEDFTFLVRQRGRRLIQQKYLHIVVHGPCNDKKLLLGNPDFFYLCLGFQAQSKIINNLLGFPVHFVIVNKTPMYRIFIHKEIFRHTQLFQHVKVLGNHDDSFILGIQYGLKLTVFPAKFNCAGKCMIGIYARQHFHKGRFPGPVASHDGMHLAAEQFQVGFRYCFHSWEFFCQAMYLKYWFSFFHVPYAPFVIRALQRNGLPVRKSIHLSSRISMPAATACCYCPLLPPDKPRFHACCYCPPSICSIVIHPSGAICVAHSSILSFVTPTIGTYFFGTL